MPREGVEPAAALPMAAAPRAVHLEQEPPPQGPPAVPKLVPVQRQLGGQPVGERVRAGRPPQRGPLRRLPKPELESRQRSPLAEKGLARRRLRPERRPRHVRAVRKKPEPGRRQGGNLRPAVQANPDREGPPSRANGAGAPKRLGQRAVPRDRLAFPPAQCPRRGYSQVAALFLAYYVAMAAPFLEYHKWKERAFLDRTE